MSDALVILPKGRKSVGSATESLIIPEAIAAAGPEAVNRLIEFFTAHIRNRNTREAYGRACSQFFDWMAENGLADCRLFQPVHVAGWVEAMLRENYEIPTVKQRLAAVRMLFDWLVTGGIIRTNPAASVRGPRYSVNRGKTPILDGSEAGQLLKSIPTSNLAGLRDRALIALMTYSFARISAAVGMQVSDIFVERKRLWVRLKEKGGKRHEMPCHHQLEEYLCDYLEHSGLKNKPNSPLFPSLSRAQKLTDRSLHRIEAWAMVKRRAKAAGIKTEVVNHTFRGTGITAYLENGGLLERAKQMANHASTKTTQLYDRRNDKTTLDDVERIRLG
ncbi:MAG: tyrosine-type recombinase/integrase [Rhodomicrobium sp.]